MVDRFFECSEHVKSKSHYSWKIHDSPNPTMTLRIAHFTTKTDMAYTYSEKFLNWHTHQKRWLPIIWFAFRPPIKDFCWSGYAMAVDCESTKRWGRMSLWSHQLRIGVGSLIFSVHIYTMHECCAYAVWTKRCRWKRCPAIRVTRCCN